jgi:hypothetical protein
VCAQQAQGGVFTWEGTSGSWGGIRESFANNGWARRLGLYTFAQVYEVLSAVVSSLVQHIVDSRFHMGQPHVADFCLVQTDQVTQVWLLQSE